MNCAKALRRYAMATIAITAKNALYLFSGSRSYMALLDTRGKARSTAATMKAQNISAMNIFLCGLK